MAIAAERLHRITADVYERMAANGFLPERGVELIDGLVLEMSPKGSTVGAADLSERARNRHRLVVVLRSRHSLVRPVGHLQSGPRRRPGLPQPRPCRRRRHGEAHQPSAGEPMIGT